MDGETVFPSMHAHNRLKKKYLALLALFAGGLAARESLASPILITMESERGVSSFVIDRALQPDGLADISEYSGDYIGKDADYRINVADYYHAEKDGLVGYGYDWLLERYPPGLGIYEDYGELWFITDPDRYQIITGSRYEFWEVGTPLYWREFAGEEYRSEDYRIASMQNLSPDSVPEPSALALFVLGAALMGGGVAYRSFRA